MTTVPTSADVYRAADRLYRSYPEAQDSDSMTVMTTDGGREKFYLLTSDKGSYYLRRRAEAGVLADVYSDGTGVCDDPAEARDILTRAVPLPRDGALYGWRSGAAVTALVGFTTDHTPEIPEPSWATMPRGATAPGEWPPFTSDRLFGASFWEYRKAGRIVNLAPLIAKHEGQVFWVLDPNVDGGLVVVRTTLKASKYLLPCGVYAYFTNLRDGKLIPSAGKLLAASGRVDLAPRLG